MTSTDSDPHEDHFAEFAEELRLLAEAVLERVEPVLRRAAAEGRTDWESCSWCPVCAAAALVRGEHHDVVAAIAENGTAIVTVLREALAGVPVDPVMPPEFDHDAPQDNSPETSGDEVRSGDADDVPAEPDGTMGRVSDASDNSAAAGRRGASNRAGGKPSLGATLLGALAGRAATAPARDSRPEPNGQRPGEHIRKDRSSGRSGYVPIPVQINR
ncbi:hypothetical protein NDR87_07760 [Nocardia sp. CDC159]|uniref:Uncharacterized protein n=1 Tax=Nocardia pulmonis TaxID=2951408 RepID=A0A9X2IWB0_9NOCA|nr:MULTISPECIES: hypothetical protein [Nocardia]MCM6773364.1 hypothetical protein [Nocardia pulmonis]MCM6786251.1 hypothetical protein [Nocardia sp. CDC159]